MQRDTAGIQQLSSHKRTNSQQSEVQVSMTAATRSDSYVPTKDIHKNAFEYQKSIQDQNLAAVTTLVEKTQQAVILEEVAMIAHLAQIYRELGDNRIQIHRLSQSLNSHQERM